MRGQPTLIALLLSGMVVSSCETMIPPDHPSRGAFVKTQGDPAPAPEVQPYRLELGDVVDVKLFYHAELNETVQVRPDGKIALQLVGEVEARGVSPEDLARTLTERYVRAGLRGPVVSVLLRKSAGLKVFVGGEVNNAKMVPYEGRLTLTQAIVEAGGMKTTAEPQSILVLRDSGKGTPLYMTVDAEQERLAQGKDLALQPYDVVFVPKSGIAKANQFVEQYLSNMVPRWVSGTAGFAYTLGTIRTPVP